MRSSFLPGYSNQAAYLERLKLLTDAERGALPAGAFEPVRYVETAY